MNVMNRKGHFTHETEGPQPLHFKHSRLVEKAKLVQVCLRTNTVSKCKMDVEYTWSLTWDQVDNVSWSLGLFLENHLLEVGLTQNRKTMALQKLPTINLFYFIMCEDLHE